MSQTAIQPVTGTLRADPSHSSFTFAVTHSGAYRFRGSLSGVAATLRAGGDGPVLEGSARVDSIDVVAPDALRASVLGPEFLDAERHPEITFRSTDVRFDDDGRAEVDGELTIRGVSRPVAATGRYRPPRATAFGSEVAGLGLRTTIDRRDFGLAWQMELPGGGEVLGWDVDLDVELLLVRDGENGEG